MAESNAAELLVYLEPYDERSCAKTELLRRLLELQASKRPNNRKRKMPVDTNSYFEKHLNTTRALFRLSITEELWDDWQLNRGCDEEVCADVLALAKVTGDKLKALKLALYPEVDQVLQNKRLYFELFKHILRPDPEPRRKGEACTEEACQNEEKRVRLMSRNETCYQTPIATSAQDVLSSSLLCQIQDIPLQLSQFVGRRVKTDPFLCAMLASHTWRACCDMDREIDIAGCMFKVPIYDSGDWIVGMYWSVAWGLRYITSTAVPSKMYDVPTEKLPEDWQETVKPNGWSISMPCDHLVGDAFCYIRVPHDFGLLLQLPEVERAETTPQWLA